VTWEAKESWYGPAAGVIATLILVDATLSGGVFEAEFGSYAPFFWAAIVLWFAVATLALWRRQIWWVAFTAPIILFPLILWGGLALACLRGDCL
jgi:hypothetical protein